MRPSVQYVDPVTTAETYHISILNNILLHEPNYSLKTASNGFKRQISSDTGSGVTLFVYVLITHSTLFEDSLFKEAT